MDKGFKEHFVAERAKAMAVMVLTRREGLRIVEAKEDLGLDYLAYITDEGQLTQRPFGVYIRATMTPVTVAAANAQLRPAVGVFRQLKKFPYPVFLMYFTIKDEKGYYTWLDEPVVTDDKPRLQRRDRPDCAEIGKGTMDEIVDQIDAWYEALYAALTV